MWQLLLSIFYKQENWGTERLNNLPKVPNSLASVAAPVVLMGGPRTMEESRDLERGPPGPNGFHYYQELPCLFFSHPVASAQ